MYIFSITCQPEQLFQGHLWVKSSGRIPPSNPSRLANRYIKPRGSRMQESFDFEH